VKQIIITSENSQIRAAVLERGKLTELLDDSGREFRLAGSVFKGKVTNIVSGIQAAFVDIGTGKNAFLYVGDVVVPEYFGDEKILPKIIPSIDNFLKEGQEVIVQVIREPVGKKGARVTTNLSLPGRFTVLLPGNKDFLGISRKILDDKEKQRLFNLGRKLKPNGAGLILRTMADGVSEKEIIEDVEKLCVIQQDLEQRIRKVITKGLIYSSNDPFSRLLRETIDESVDEIIIDNGDLAQILREKLKEVNCSAAGKVWTDFGGALFERYGINLGIRNALRPKVELESGGYLVIEQTEALAVVDVNSGKYTGNKSLQDTLLSLNIEAAAEISRQIKLRNLSGIIIIDFIDMDSQEDWDILIAYFNKALTQKAKCKVLGQTKLGLVEITRKKEGQTLAARYTAPCPKCSGRGWLENNVGLKIID